MYSDINQWLCTFQSYVQLSRLKIQTAQPRTPDTTVQIFERSVQNNRFCFVEQAHNVGNLNGADYGILDQWYRWIMANVDISLDLIGRYMNSSADGDRSVMSCEEGGHTVASRDYYLMSYHNQTKKSDDVG